MIFRNERPLRQLRINPYFSENNGLFRKLFRYINQNDISMTTPVEADINPGKMRFFVGSKDLPKDFQDSEEVKVVKLKQQKVVSIGIRGGYSEKRYQENLVKLNQWLDKNSSYEKAENLTEYTGIPLCPRSVEKIRNSYTHSNSRQKTN